MKLLITIFGYALLIYVSFVGGLFLAQRDMIYFPGYDKPVIASSGIIGMNEVTVTTDDGLNLFGWYKEPSQLEKPTIVWFHGNASNVGWTSTRAIPFIKQGYGVLLVEYRGYASNPGHPSESGLYQDGRAFIKFLLHKNVPQSSIVLYGESIGSGVAVQMATEYPSMRALVLEAPFTSALDMAKARYPFMPVDMMLKDRYDNLAKIKDIKMPLVLAHGDKDKIIPYNFGQALYDAAPEPKSMITIQGGGHNDLSDFDVADKIISSLSE